jgi:hypothetical protein
MVTASNRDMDPTYSTQTQMLEEDLLIVRATLETISGNIRQVSGRAADEIEQAVEKLEHAQMEFARARDAAPVA